MGTPSIIIEQLNRSIASVRQARESTEAGSRLSKGNLLSYWQTSDKALETSRAAAFMLTEALRN
jgi:hypothetical protein